MSCPSLPPRDSMALREAEREPLIVFSSSSAYRSNYSGSSPPSPAAIQLNSCALMPIGPSLVLVWSRDRSCWRRGRWCWRGSATSSPPAPRSRSAGSSAALRESIQKYSFKLNMGFFMVDLGNMKDLEKRVNSLSEENAGKWQLMLIYVEISKMSRFHLITKMAWWVLV